MTTKSLLQAIHDGLAGEMRADETVMVLGEDVGRAGGVFRVTEGLQEEFGEYRVMDTPLAESLIAGAAIGLSVNGMRPVAEIQFADFIPPAFDQIVSEAARFYYRSGGAYYVPITVRVPYGVVPGGALYHSQSVEAWFCNTPGLKVVAPTYPADAEGLLRSAIRDPNPVVFFEHKRCYRLLKEEVPEGGAVVPVGKARIHRAGTDLTVVSYGFVLHQALEVAEKLSTEHGVEAEVVEPLTLYPLDRGTIVDSAKKTGKVLVASEANLTGSVSAEIAAVVAREAFEWLDAPVMRLGAPDVPTAPFAKPLLESFMPGAEKIEAALLELARY
ncbi:MAG: Branched-chain alpha-keto acid dehydrogenase, E1 component, beta subunit [uncultured Rubrobacteraceae bacterium]|uniref:Branched-chain alpha-keto acid dehydrogenase, E1 component, beta subunit n=1 Tax=uncultured Rubrobacteraceae bacterium TaxID=349277 RepID=A0A6J4RDE0_9ACTN|nr:MAG: Branched-chain alpha-keto acid dehydrogenase, E1 component, beta subunit [uncultured Rubrobacteraceae bacterium]